MAEITSPFKDKLFKITENGGGFQNDITPLDEYNMNLIIKAILENRDNIAARVNSDKAINKAAFGTDDAPTDGDSLQTQINNAIDRDKSINIAAFGDEETPDSGDSLQAQIRANKDTLSRLESLNFDILEIDGGEVPEKNVATWDGKYDATWGNL